MSILKDKRLLFSPLLFAAVVFICRCTKATSSITQGIYYSPEMLDPAQINDIVTLQIFPHLIETLIIIDPETDTLKAHLAESWKVDELKSTFTISIKKNLLCHDGRKLTSRDIAFSLLRQFDAKCDYYVTNSLLAEFYESLIDEIAIKGDYEIVIHLRQPNVLFPYILSSPYCAGILSQRSIDKNGRFMQLIGTGPYSYDRRDSSGDIYLNSFKDYWQKSSIINTIQFKVHSQSILEKLAIEGTIDVLHRIRGTMAERFLENDSFNLLTLEPITTFYLGFNLKRSIFRNISLRYEIMHGIDKVEIAASLNRTNADIAFSPLPVGIYNARIGQNGKDIVFSAEGKKGNDSAALAVIGYTPDDRTKLLYGAILKYVKNAGLNVQEKYFSDWESYFEARERGEYDMFFSTWRSDFVGDPYFFLHSLFHSESTNNYFNYRSAAVDSLLNLARVTESREVRDTYYQRILMAIEEDCPGVFIHHPKEVFVVNKRFSPILIDPYGYIHFEKITTF